MMNNIQQFQQMRQNRTIDNVARRSLYPTQAVASDDPLGPLSEGWGNLLVCINNNNNTQDDIYSAVIMTTRSLREFTQFI